VFVRVASGCSLSQVLVVEWLCVDSATAEDMVGELLLDMSVMVSGVCVMCDVRVDSEGVGVWEVCDVRVDSEGVGVCVIRDESVDSEGVAVCVMCDA
jgi:hypothetical protein